MPCAFHARRPWPFRGLGPGCQFAEDPVHPLVESGDEQWCRFHLPLDAPGADGVRKVDWDGKKFATFNEAIFAHIDTAKEASQRADLTGVVFPGDISFDRYRGEEKELPAIIFFKAHFGSDADFSEAHFGSYASFGETHFGSSADFREAHFGSDAFFSGVAEDGGVGERREAVTLESRPGEAGETVTMGVVTAPARAARNDFRRADFSRARFRGSAVFSNRRFTDTTRFVGATFHQAPKFHNAALHQDTDFTGAAFLDRSGRAAPAYRTLKLAMEQVRARDEEGMFYALEMESRRRRDDTPKAVKLFSLLYEVGSDYGRSLVRPLVLLVGVTLLFYLIYAALGSEGGREAYPGAPLRLAMEQIVRPFALLTTDYESIAPYSDYTEQVRKILDGAPFAARALATVQSLLSLGLIALFILALRRRFRMA